MVRKCAGKGCRGRKPAGPEPPERKQDSCIEAAISVRIHNDLHTFSTEFQRKSSLKN